MSEMYEKAQTLLDQYIKNENLKKHCYAVETCMKYYAKVLNQDEELWGMTGLLHDLDWESNPDTHPLTAVPILEAAGFPKEMIDAILGHAYPDRSDVARTTLLAKYLFACDELSGFINAYSLMKPGRLNDVEATSVVKKMKDKAFARNVSRDDMYLGSEEIGLPIEEHTRNLIEAMRGDSRLA